MIIKSSKEYHYLVVFSLFSVVLFFFVMCSVSDSIKFPVVSVIPLLILVIRAWISSCRTYIIDEGGITVRFLWYQRTFKWDELKTKRIENYSNSIGYRQPYTRGVIFYNKDRYSRERRISMDIEVIIEGHEQRIKTLERDMSAMREVQAEIRSMNETLVTLANELKHTNEHLKRHERKIDEIDSIPKQRIQQIITAIIAALSGGLISTVIGTVFI